MAGDLRKLFNQLPVNTNLQETSSMVTSNGDNILYRNTILELKQLLNLTSISDDLRDGVPTDADTLNKINNKILGIQTLLQSDNVNLDNVQELVDAIETIQTSLSNILVDDLVTGGVTKALTAEQGKTLKIALDTLTTVVNSKANQIDTYTKTETNNLLSTKVDEEVGKGLSTEDYTTVEKTKLAGIANNATANSTDAQLRDRATHTGLQPISTVDGLDSALLSKADKTTTYTKTEVDSLLLPKVVLADITSAIDSLKGGVPLDGDTLAKLNNKIASINTILASDNVDLDNVQELVDAIETLQTSLSTILVNDLVSGGVTKALTAEQGKVLKDTLDALTVTVSNKANIVHTHAISDIVNLQSILDTKVILADITAAIDVIKDGVSVDGDTLKKLNDKIAGINTILASDNVNLDNVQELVDAIETIQTSLASILVNDLTTGGVTKALTAEQGKNLKTLIDNLTTLVGSPFVGATSSTAGVVGHVPAPAVGDENKALFGDGTFKRTVQQYDSSSAYNSGDLAILAGQIIIANGEIPAGTPFAWGDTGTSGTWAPQLAFQYLWAGIYNPTTTYTAGQVTVSTSTALNVYRSESNGNTGNAYNTGWWQPLWSEFLAISPMLGATDSTNGLQGFVPRPLIGDQIKSLFGDGTYKTVQRPLTPQNLTTTGNVTAWDSLVICNSTTAITVTLPTIVADSIGRGIIVKNIGAGAVTVASSDAINGQNVILQNETVSYEASEFGQAHAVADIRAPQPLASAEAQGYASSNATALQTINVTSGNINFATVQPAGQRITLPSPAANEANVSGNVVTIQKAGRYSVDANVSLNSNGVHFVQLVKNSNTILSVQTTWSGGGYYVIPLAWSGDLLANDTLELRLGCQNAGNSTIFATSFSLRQLPFSQIVPANAVPVTELAEGQTGPTDIVNGQTTTSTTYVDITGASITVPGPGRFEIEYNIPTNNNTVGQVTSLALTDSSNNIITSGISAMAEANGGGFTGANYGRVVVVVSAATTYKVRWRTSGGTSIIGNETSGTAGSGSAWLRYQQLPTSTTVNPGTVPVVNLAYAHFNSPFGGSNVLTNITGAAVTIPLNAVNQRLLSGITFNDATDTLVVNTSGIYRISLTTTAISGAGTYSQVPQIRINNNTVSSNSASNTVSLRTNCCAEFNGSLIAGDIISFAIGQSTNNIDVTAISVTVEQLPSATIISTGATIVNQVAEQNEIILASNLALTTGTITTVLETPILSEGTWEIEAHIAFQTSGAAQTANAALYDTSNLVSPINGTSQRLYSGAAGGGGVAIVKTAKFESNGSKTIAVRVKENAADLQILGNEAMSATANTGSVTKLIYRKIAGTLPSTGQTVDYINTALTTTYVVSSTADSNPGEKCPIGTVKGGNIVADTNVNTFTLLAGKTYKLAFGLRCDVSGAQLVNFEWYNETTNTFIDSGTIAAVIGLVRSDNVNNLSLDNIETIFTPIVNTVVSVRLKKIAGQSVTVQAAYFNIVQIGSSAYTTLTLPGEQVINNLLTNLNIPSWNTFVLGNNNSASTIRLPPATINDLGKKITIRQNAAGPITVVATGADGITGRTTLVGGQANADTIEYVVNAVGSIISKPIGKEIREPVVQRFTTNGTYTPTPGMVYCVVEAVGGGGAGNGAPANPGAQTGIIGGPGCSGGYIKAMFTAAQIGVSRAVVIGAGGAGVNTNTTGASGGDTTLGGTLLVANGGPGGIASSVNSNYVGGMITVSRSNTTNTLPTTTGTLIIANAPNPGTDSIASMNNSFFGWNIGNGGNSVMGPGAKSGGYSNTNINTGIAIAGVTAPANSGGGGVGAMVYVTGSAQFGGTGGSGLMVITEYFQ